MAGMVSGLDRKNYDHRRAPRQILTLMGCSICWHRAAGDADDVRDDLRDYRH